MVTAIKSSANPSTVVLPDFDLGKIMARVANEHPDWSEARLAVAEQEYRAFFAVAKVEGPLGQRPGKDVDEVWHSHILHTMEYSRDCLNYLGHFLHHTPDDPNSPQQDDRICGSNGPCSVNCGI